MPSNRGQTSLKRRRRTSDAMKDFDRLPSELRCWLAKAVLPWRPRSVKRTFASALSRTNDPDRALREMDRIEQRLIARDVRKTWGEDHPAAAIEAKL